MNINVLFKIDVFANSESVKVAENLSMEAYQKRVSMILDKLISILHKSVKVSYSADCGTCTIELEDSISFNKYKVLKFYLTYIDLLNDIKLAFDINDAFSFNNECFFYVFQDDKEYIAVILQGYKLRNIIQALKLTTGNSKIAVDAHKLNTLWPSVNQILETYYHICKDFKD